MTYRRRELAGLTREALASMPVVVVTGLRQSGKTTFLREWSVQGRHEVDFIVSRGRDVVAIEVKAGSRFRDKDLAGLRAFSSKTPGVRAAVLAYNGVETVKLGEALYAVPLATLLS